MSLYRFAGCQQVRRQNRFKCAFQPAFRSISGVGVVSRFAVGLHRANQFEYVATVCQFDVRSARFGHQRSERADVIRAGDKFSFIGTGRRCHWCALSCRQSTATMWTRAFVVLFGDRLQCDNLSESAGPHESGWGDSRFDCVQRNCRLRMLPSGVRFRVSHAAAAVSSSRIPGTGRWHNLSTILYRIF